MVIVDGRRVRSENSPRRVRMGDVAWSPKCGGMSIQSERHTRHPDLDDVNDNWSGFPGQNDEMPEMEVE
jgi:hypothetical protein